MPRGGPRPNSGGRRPGAGRKVEQSVLDFRKWVREWVESPAGRKHILKRMKESDSILAKVLDKCYATPQSIKLGDAEGRPIRLMLGSEGNELELPYLPKGPMIIHPR